MKIIHLKQLHKLPSSISADAVHIQKVVESQFKIAQFILTHPTYPIILESLTEDVENAHVNRSSDDAKILFPEGFPEDVSLLNEAQKGFLYENGATLTLFYLGKVKKIYKSIEAATSSYIDSEVRIGNYSNIFHPREEAAIFHSKEAAKKHFGTINESIVILVYGAGHDFKPYCDKEGLEYESINTTSIERTRPSNTNHFYPIRERAERNTLTRFSEKRLSSSSSSEYKNHSDDIKNSDSLTPFFSSNNKTTIEGAMLIVGSICLTIQKQNESPFFPYTLVVTENEKEQTSLGNLRMDLKDKDASEMAALIGSDDISLMTKINLLRGMGSPASNLATLLETEIGKSIHTIDTALQFSF